MCKRQVIATTTGTLKCSPQKKLRMMVQPGESSPSTISIANNALPATMAAPVMSATTAAPNSTHTSAPATTSTTTTTTTDTITSTIRRRKRVCFEEDAMTQEVKHRIVEFRPMCNELSDDERYQRWLQRDEKAEIRRTAADDVVVFRCAEAFSGISSGGDVESSQLTGTAGGTARPLQPAPVIPPAFTEAYAGLYVACHSQTDQDDEGSTTSSDSFFPDSCAFTAPCNIRGLEDLLVPNIAIERRVRRRQTIRDIILASRALHDQPDTVCELSRFLTDSSRKFGHALGIVDATSAMMEYKQWLMTIVPSS